MTDDRRLALLDMAEHLHDHMTAAYSSAKERAEDLHAMALAMDAWAEVMHILMDQSRDLAAVLRDDGVPR